MRLIDADKLFPYGAVAYYQDDGFKTADRIYGIIDEAPTVDAVPVIRCKDCKRRKNCTHARRLGINGFCSEGEKT